MIEMNPTPPSSLPSEILHSFTINIFYKRKIETHRKVNRAWPKMKRNKIKGKRDKKICERGDCIWIIRSTKIGSLLYGWKRNTKERFEWWAALFGWPYTHQNRLAKVESATGRKLIRLTKPRLNENNLIQSKTKSKEHGDRRQKATGHRNLGS